MMTNPHMLYQANQRIRAALQKGKLYYCLTWNDQLSRLFHSVDDLESQSAHQEASGAAPEKAY